MNYLRGALATLILGITGNAIADLGDVPSGEYGLDKNHGYISFTYSHFGYSDPHVGFNSFDLTLNLDSANPENNSVEVIIDATSVDSRVEDFNDHLNGPDFFDTANHPTITFKSTSFKATSDDTFDVAGDLTIKGITQSVTLRTVVNKAAEHPRKKTPVVGVGATGTVSRSAFGLDHGVPNVGDEVTLYISVEMPLKSD